MHPPYGDGPGVRNGSNPHRSAQPPASNLVGQSRRRRSPRHPWGRTLFMTRAVPLRDDLVQSDRPARSLRNWLAGVPAIVAFSRGWRLGKLAAAGRASGTAELTAIRSEPAAVRAEPGGGRPRSHHAEPGGERSRSYHAEPGEKHSRSHHAEPVAVRDALASDHAAALAFDVPSALNQAGPTAGHDELMVDRAEATAQRTEATLHHAEATAQLAEATGVQAASGSKRRKVVGAGAAGVVGMLLVPLPASAAPAPCEQAERYSAQSGSQILRLTQLDLGEAGKNASGTGTDGSPRRAGAAGSSGDASKTGADAPGPGGDASKTGADASGPGGDGSGHGGSQSGDASGQSDVQEVHVGEAKSAMVAQASVSSAAVARMIDAGGEGTPAELTEAVQQQAPPTNAEPVRRSTGAADVGPVSLGAGKMTTHARWEAGMACGATVGDVTRATARLRGAGIVADGDTALVRVPGKVESESTTKLERRGAAAATVATAGLHGGDLELLGGAVKVKVIKAPSLRASMSIQDGGEVRYLPAVIEVSGRGFKTERLSAAGDDIEIEFDEPDRRAATESSSGAATDGLLGKLPLVGGLLGSGNPLPLPEVPGLPEVAQPGSKPAPVAEPGTRVRISLGDVRQASRGRAIAARAAAMSVVVTHSSSGKRTKPGYAQSAALAFDMGVLEAAAVAPETGGGVSAGAVSDATGGEGGGLPITGPRVDVIALSGVALMIAGAAALIFGLRGRSRP
ncbi:hypothetical protein AB0J80_11005 [Actinoplanes sp. NPDC049548]|uniref:hypothetical protein n=1 Tax=Actinoplanes sp. NPDC049548 TaxID=3155152 RepID=UPI003444F834